MKEHIAVLEQRIRAFDENKDQLDSLSDQLLPVIHWPGWTTVAELAFVNLALEALEQHTESVIRIQTQLVTAAKLVGAASRAEARAVQQTAEVHA